MDSKLTEKKKAFLQQAGKEKKIQGFSGANSQYTVY